MRRNGARRQAEEPRKTVTPIKSKKKKTVSPELEKRQKRASARMQELGVPQLQARIHLLFLAVVQRPVIYVITYYIFP